MIDQHPITPPPELVQQWLGEFFNCVVSGELSDSERYITTKAARWGADQELEACCEWLETYVQRWAEWSANFRADRRPKPPSLKEQALKALDDISIASFEQDAANTIRYALEQLDD